eukprot:7666612-Alexandrium_andersonii.AAC.2
MPRPQVQLPSPYSSDLRPESQCAPFGSWRSCHQHARYTGRACSPWQSSVWPRKGASVQGPTFVPFGTSPPWLCVLDSGFCFASEALSILKHSMPRPGGALSRGVAESALLATIAICSQRRVPSLAGWRVPARRLVAIVVLH